MRAPERARSLARHPVSLPRRVAPEVLDGLEPHDPRATRARRDLYRINEIMGSGRFLARGLRPARMRGPPPRLLELGAGDGRLTLRLARLLRPSWPVADLTLLDRQRLLEPDSKPAVALARMGWRVEFLCTDALDWAGAADDALPRWDAIFTNLFLHHFEAARLRSLLAAVAERCDLFVACEPRRARRALLGSHLLGAVGAGNVARGDAVLSVHAGFCGQEICAAWPAAREAWSLEERPAGLFVHFFRAARRETRAAAAM